MKNFFSVLLLIAFAALTAVAQTSTSRAKSDEKVKQQIIKMETRWADALKRQDVAAASQILADDYVLVIAVQGEPIRTVPREQWLKGLKDYVTEANSIDEIRVGVYGNTAVVFMLYTQKATVRNQDRSAQFAITDIWVKRQGRWRVAERHSSRPEPRAAARP